MYCVEDWGEDMVLTAHMGVAFASGLSKNSTWSDPDAVVPVMKVRRSALQIISHYLADVALFSISQHMEAPREDIMLLRSWVMERERYFKKCLFPSRLRSTWVA